MIRTIKRTIQVLCKIIHHAKAILVLSSRQCSSFLLRKSCAGNEPAIFSSSTKTAELLHHMLCIFFLLSIKCKRDMVSTGKNS